MAGIVAPFIGAYFALDRFVADRGRVPDKSEKWWLVGVSFRVTMVWSVIVVIVVLVLVASSDDMDDVGAGAVAGVAVSAVLVTFLMTWFGYSFWPKRAVRNRERMAEGEAKGRWSRGSDQASDLGPSAATRAGRAVAAVDLMVTVPTPDGSGLISMIGTPRAAALSGVRPRGDDPAGPDDQYQVGMGE